MTQPRITSFEWGRLVAMFAIITIHSQIFVNLPLANDVPWLNWLINQFSRFAVPFFFILAGYLIQPKLESTPWQTLKRYIKPLAIVWLSWSVICLVLPFNLTVFMEQGYLAERTRYWQYLAQSPLNALFEGGLVHLWYLPALAIAVALVALIGRLRQSYWLWITALAFYLYGVGAGSYYSVTEWYSPIFTRNGPFFGYLMVLIGYEIRRRHIQFNLSQAVAFFFIGMTLHLGEGYWLYHAHQLPMNGHDFLLGTPLWGLGFFALMQSRPQWGEYKVTTQISPHILGIYLAHLLVIIYYGNLMRFLGVSDWLYDLSILPATVLLTWWIVKQIEKTPLRTVLLRG